MISNNNTNLNLSYHPPNPCLLLLPRSLMLSPSSLPFPLSLSICIHLHSTATHRHRFLQILQEGLGKQEGFLTTELSSLPTCGSVDACDGSVVGRPAVDPLRGGSSQTSCFTIGSVFVLLGVCVSVDVTGVSSPASPLGKVASLGAERHGTWRSG